MPSYIDFPTSGLVAGVTTYTYGGTTWLWNGYAWDNASLLEIAQGVQGLQGPQGTQGPQGVQGVQGATPTISYVHSQGVSSDTWLITHNLGFYPNITVKDSGGSVVEGEISYTNSNSLTLTFSAAFSGTAYLS